MSQAAVDARLSVAVGRPGWPVEEERQPNLNISVLFTTVDSTLAALKCAGRLAGDLGARISLVVTQVGPYPLPLDRPPISQEVGERRFRVIAGESRVETSVAGVFLPRSTRYIDRCAQATLRDRCGREEAPLEPCLGANARETTSKRTAPRRARSDFFRNGVRHHAGSALCRHWLSIFDCVLGLHEGLRQALGDLRWITSLPESLRSAC
jgi:hypothetical protein